jgi:hypothetical protein
MVTLSSGEYKKTVVQDGVAKCPDCGSTDPMMGACPIGAMTVHQEYVCNVYQNEFKALYAHVDFYKVAYPRCHAATLAALARQPVRLSVWVRERSWKPTTASKIGVAKMGVAIDVNSILHKGDIRGD